MRKAITIGTIIIVPTLVILVLASAAHVVWIPDIFSGKTISVGSAENKAHDRFDLTQKWIGDGYLTLIDVPPHNGEPSLHVIDGDAFKIWRCTWTIDEKKQTASVASNGVPLAIYDWSSKTFRRFSNGVEIP